MKPVLAIAAAVGILATACGPAGPPAGGADPGAPAAPITGPKTLTIALEAEPKDALVGSIAGGTGTIAGDLKLAVHQVLANFDDKGNVHPMLARELPAQEKGTWVVRPDGTMQTTYRIHDTVTWHDGAPLTVRDFVFGWTVTRDPDVEMRSRRLARAITSIETPDSHTLVLEWAETNPFANAITEDEIGPIAAHLMEDLYRTDKERFNNSPYWTREFVGVGPFRLEEWSPGSHMTMKAYDRFYRGRARIDALILRFVTSEQTVVANLLAGSVDGILGAALSFGQVMFVKEEWERAGLRPLTTFQVTHWRVLEPQFRPDLARPRDILDVHVRRGLLHAFDRQAIVDTLFAGAVAYSDAFVPPDDVKWDWVKGVVAKYPYDPRRAQDVLAEAGWRRGPDGAMVNPAGERVTIPIDGQQGEQGEQEQAIIAAGWRAIGINVEQRVRTPAEARENRLISIFPGFSASAMPLRFTNTTQRVHSSLCPGDHNRWLGPNHGCYQNPGFDRVSDALQRAISEDDQRRLYRDIVRLYTEDLPVYPLYFNPRPVIFRHGVVNVKGDTKPRTSQTWNAAEWDIAG